MLKKIGALLATGLGLVLLVYSATRAMNFIALTLPADKQILAWFGLAALDGGLIAWTLAYLHGSRGWQRPIALGMVLVDLVGAVGMFTLDTLYHMGQAGMTAALTPEELQNAALALSGVIALNISATVAHHLTDPDRLKEQAEEEAFDKVEDATLKQISQNADQLAAQVAPMLAADWVDRTRARYLANVGKKAHNQIIDSTARDVTPPPALPVAKESAGQPAIWPGLVMPWTKSNGKHKAVNMETVAPGTLVDVDESEEAWLESIKGFYRILRNDEAGNATVIKGFTPTTAREFRSLKDKSEGLRLGEYYIWSANNIPADWEGESGASPAPFRKTHQ